MAWYQSSEDVMRLSDRAARDELSVADLSHSTFGIVDTGIAGSMLGTGIMYGTRLQLRFEWDFV